jgi:uncharacterized lipoprotein YmbA
MNAIPELLKPNSAFHCPGGAPSVSKLSKTRRKLVTHPEGLRASAFGCPISDLLSLLLTLAACACLTGCSFLKPAKPTARYFVLMPLPATSPALTAPDTLAVGLGQVKLPAYLFETSLAVRKGTNQIEYLPSSLWAERLDTGFQRVLAANLAILLPTDRIHLSAWKKEAVAAEAYVTLEQFDVDASGRGVLVARWRILSPGGEKTLKAGECRLNRQGSPPDADPSGAVTTLSELLADFSRQLVQALQEAAAVPRLAPTT